MRSLRTLRVQGAANVANLTALAALREVQEFQLEDLRGVIDAREEDNIGLLHDVVHQRIRCSHELLTDTARSRSTEHRLSSPNVLTGRDPRAPAARTPRLRG